MFPSKTFLTRVLPVTALLALSLNPTLAADAPATIQAEPNAAPTFKLQHAEWVGRVALSADGATLASETSQKKGEEYVHMIYLWNLKDGKEEKSWEVGTDEIDALASSPDGQTLAMGGERTIRLWDLTGKLQKTWSGHTHEVGCLAFSPDGKMLATSSRARMGDKPVSEIFLWDVASGKKRQLPVEVPERTSFVGVTPSLAFSRDGSRLVASQSHFRVGIWNVASGQLETSIGDETVKGIITALALSPDGKVVATGHMGHSLRLWDAQTGEARQTLLSIKENWDGNPPEGEVVGLVFSSNGQTLVSAGTNQEGAGGEAELLQWDFPKRTLLRSLIAAPAEGIKRFAAARDASTFATVESLSSTIKVWHVAP